MLKPTPSTSKDLPLVSIITVVYNGVAHLEKTILSVLNQTYPNIEYIIIDGGSTDGTLDIIRRYDSQIDYWVSEPDKGIYDAMNKGIALATGEVIGLLNAGDWYLKKTLEIVIQYFQTNTYISPTLMISGAIKILLPHKSVIIVPSNAPIWQKMPFPHPALFVSRQVYEQLGLFDAKLKICADYDFLWRALKFKVPYYLTQEVFTEILQPGVSGNYFARNQEDHIIRVRHGISPIKSFFTMLQVTIIDIGYEIFSKTRHMIRGY